MKKKNTALLGLVSALCLGGLTTIGITKGSYVPQRTSDTGQSIEKRGTIKWFVARAKQQKKSKVLVPPPEELYGVVRDLDDAAAQYAAVLVQPISRQAAVLNDSDIVTWNKFKVLEFISYPANGCRQCSGGLTAPPEMLPLNAGEILIPVSGGSLTVDGIQLESRHKDFSEPFLASDKYLLFLSFDPTTSIGKLSLGPTSIFVVTGQDRIIPITQHHSPIGRDLESKLANSLSRLRDHLRTRSN